MFNVYLLQLFRRVLQHCFAVKLQKCFADDETGKWQCKIFVVCSKWVKAEQQSVPLNSAAFIINVEYYHQRNCMISLLLLL